MSHFPAPKIVVVGSTSVDHVSIFDSLAAVREPRRMPREQYVAFGGGGTNAAIAITELFKAENIQPDVTLFTRAGRQDFFSAGAYPKVVDNSRRTEYLGYMGDRGIRVVDTARETPHKIPFNVVHCDPQDRQITRDLESSRISAHFNSEAAEILPETQQTLQAKIADADAVVIFASFGKEAVLAAQIAAEVRARRSQENPQRPLSIIVDYDVTSVERSRIARDILISATHILASAEALAPGMETPNDKVLFDTIVKDPVYTARLTAVSDAGRTVMVNHNYSDNFVDPGQPIRVVDSLGAGDVRTAKMAMEVIKKTPDKEALLLANRVATFSTQFVGRGWIPPIAAFFETPEYRAEKPERPVGLHLVAA